MKMFALKLGIFSRIIAAIILLVPPFASLAEGPSDYPLIDSRIATSGYPQSVWLDNERVVFWGKDQSKIVKGKPFPEYERPKGKRPGWSYSTDQFVWNVRTGDIDRTIRPMFNLCAYDGEVGYLSEEPSHDPVRYWYSGVYGKETRQPLPDGGIDRVNPHSCRFYPSDLPWDKAREKGHIPRPLLEQHGYIDEGPDVLPREAGYPVLVTPSRPDSPVKLTPLWNTKESWFFRYAPHADAYVVYQLVDTPTAFLMKPNGELTRANFPPGGPRRYGGPIFYTKQGFFYYNLEGRNNVEDTATAGGYLLTSGQLRRIVVGVLDGVSVSPDGCRIAFSHAPSAKAHYDGLENYQRGGLSNTTMKMINVCKAGRKQL